MWSWCALGRGGGYMMYIHIHVHWEGWGGETHIASSDRALRFQAPAPPLVLLARGRVNLCNGHGVEKVQLINLPPLPVYGSRYPRLRP